MKTSTIDIVIQEDEPPSSACVESEAEEKPRVERYFLLEIDSLARSHKRVGTTGDGNSATASPLLNS